MLQKIGNKKGQSMTEYVLVVALVLGGAVAGMSLLKPKYQGAITSSGAAIDSASTKLNTALGVTN